MNLFSISQLQQFSGIKAHTIRVWEQRYNALHPNRSEGNTRYYDNSQLRRLLNIVSLMESDYKVSELCAMPDEKLFEMLSGQLQGASIENTHNYFISQLIAAGIGYDEVYFEKIFSNCLLRFGMRNTYVNVIYPLLVRMGLMWASDTIPPAQEHFISNLIRQKLFSAIDSLPPAKSSEETWLLFLPENELHELGLLFSQSLIRQAGKKVVYLGANVPLDTLLYAIMEIRPSHLFFFFVHLDLPANAQKYVDTLSRNKVKAKLHLSGNVRLIEQLEIGKNTTWIRSVEDLEKILSV